MSFLRVNRKMAPFRNVPKMRQLKVQNASFQKCELSKMRAKGRPSPRGRRLAFPIRENLGKKIKNDGPKNPFRDSRNRSFGQSFLNPSSPISAIWNPFPPRLRNWSLFQCCCVLRGALAAAAQGGGLCRFL